MVPTETSNLAKRYTLWRHIVVLANCAPAILLVICAAVAGGQGHFHFDSMSLRVLAEFRFKAVIINISAAWNSLNVVEMRLLSCFHFQLSNQQKWYCLKLKTKQNRGNTHTVWRHKWHSSPFPLTCMQLEITILNRKKAQKERNSISAHLRKVHDKHCTAADEDIDLRAWISFAYRCLCWVNRLWNSNKRTTKCYVCELCSYCSDIQFFSVGVAG